MKNMKTTQGSSSPGFHPDYAVHPGLAIAEWLDETGMTQAEFARRIGMSAKALNQMIKGHAPVTPDTGVRLEAVTGVPARIWNNKQALFAADVARIARHEKLKTQVEFLKQIPVSQLRAQGYVSAQAADKVSVLEDVLRFFGVTDADAWHAQWTAPGAAFRQSAAFKADPGAVATWLRLGELAAAQLEIGDFDKQRLLADVPRLRALTRQSDLAHTARYLQQLCGSAGVAVVIIEAAQGTRCSGAAHWPLGKPVIQLSLRHRTDDHFWFTFFHELAHVLFHGRGQVFIDNGDTADEREKAADAFARDTLIPAEDAAALPRLRGLDNIKEFAGRIGVSPGIVVGRMQHDGYLSHSYGNVLKHRF